MLASVNFGLLLTVLLPYLSVTYRTRQDIDPTRYEDPYSLANALGAIEVQRRQLNPIRSDYGYFPKHFGLSSQGVDLYDALNDPYAERYENIDRRLNRNSPQKRTAYHPHRVVPTVDELRQLFSDHNLPVKRLVPAKRRFTDEVIDDKIQSDKRSIRDDENDLNEKNERLTEKLRKMIDEAEKFDNNNVVQETKTIIDENGLTDKIKETEITKSVPLKDGSGTVTEKVVEVSENQLDKDTDKDDDTVSQENEENNSDSESVTHDTESTNGVADSKTGDLEDLINQYLSSSNVKSKRASSSDISTVKSLLRQIAELKEELSNLEIEKALEDRENDYLARALKYATLDQLIGGEEFMTKEYDDIVKATETEELLQKMLQDEDDEEGNPAPGEFAGQLEDEDDGEGFLEKRAGVDSEGWYDSPITEKVVGGAELHPSSHNKRGSIANDIGPEFPIAIPYTDVTDEINEDENDDLVNNDMLNNKNEDEIMEEVQEEKNELLHQILSGMSPQQLKQVLGGYADNEELDEDSGVCPAVMELTTDCAFTDQEGLVIDDEARSLCNRHEMCYKCGPDIGLTKERCDEGYKNTVLENCEGDVRCLRSAIVFLQMMKQYHSYSIYGAPQCQQPCVERFIYEGD